MGAEGLMGKQREEAFTMRRAARGRLLAVMAQAEAETLATSFSVPAQPVELTAAQDELRTASMRVARLMSFNDTH